MKLATAITVWEEVAEWERETFGAASSSLTLIGGHGGDVELHIPTNGPRHGEGAEEIDLLHVSDLAAGNGAGLYLHSTGGLVIR